VLVEEGAAVRNMLVDELEEPPEAPEPVLLKPTGREPLGRLELGQESEGRLALEPLMEREEITRDKSLVHGALFRA
jgi:hypothetical protein